MSVVTLSFAGIHIEASGDITVQGASINDLTTDAFLALPTHVLSVDYYIISYRYMNVSKHTQGPTQFAVVGVHENTKVLVTFPREDLRLKLKMTNGRTLSFTIGRFETKQVGKCNPPELNGFSLYHKYLYSHMLYTENS